MQPADTIRQKTICISVSFRKIGTARKVDTGDVGIEADKSMFSVIKKLFDSESFCAIQSRDSATERWLASRALPSMFRKGIYLLPVALVEEVDNRLKAIAKDRQALVEAFITDYPEILNESAKRLKSFFDIRQYPDPNGLRTMFSMKWKFLTMDVPDTLEGISMEVFKAEKEKAEKYWQDASREIRDMLRLSVAELVDDMLHKLSDNNDGKRRVFRDNGIDKAKEFLKLFEVRNVTDDVETKKLVDKARSLLRGVDAQDLRDSNGLRNHIKDGFTAIRKEVAKLVTTKPARAITFSEDV